MDLKHMQGILSSWNTFVCDMYVLNIWIRIYSDYFIERQPARAAFQVGALPKNGCVEIEVIALVGAVDVGSVFVNNTRL
ncbi:rutC family protein C23G10.2 [Eurytemora carolleeae]|uniref:rutC family protein C23G10.2 n=1 Tax=Eurytemora carolleeae TaxID=1294199 RepID=UPI000C77A2E2|nr:rutC family protein C23G10.2 [Eurytemora carolleeae]|eukprot:XP_023325636.1 rutC family protein C23G10.2-like [Eurytemora affinis]